MTIETEEEFKLLRETADIFERLYLLENIFAGKLLNNLYSEYEKINSCGTVSLLVLDYIVKELDAGMPQIAITKEAAITIACSDYIKNNFNNFKKPNLNRIKIQLRNRVPRIKKLLRDAKKYGATLSHVLAVLNKYPKVRQEKILVGRVVSYAKTGRF